MWQAPLTHWDQSARYLPAALAVRAGDALQLVARHTDKELQLGLRDVPAEKLSPNLGHLDAVRAERLAHMCGALTLRASG